MDVDTQTSTSVQELVLSLEQATLMASRIPATADPHQHQQIRSTLLSAHRRLSLFLNHQQQQQPQPQPPPLLPENSVASAVGVAGDDDNDVQMGDEEDEQNSRAATTSTAVDNVEERMRDGFIQNKRPKRSLSPSAAVVAEQRRSWENEGLREDDAVVLEYDPYTAKLRSLDLIYQFHG